MFGDLWFDLRGLIPSVVLIQMIVGHDSSSGQHSILVGIIFIFSLFNSGFDIWAFPELFILKVGGQIGDLTFTMFILVGVLGFSMDIFGLVAGIFAVGSFGFISVHLSQLFLELGPVTWLVPVSFSTRVLYLSGCLLLLLGHVLCTKVV